MSDEQSNGTVIPIGARRPQRKAKPDELAALPRMPKVKKPKPLHPCACGCGMETRAMWVAGHDSRHRGWLIRIERGLIKISDPAITDGERAVLRKALAVKGSKVKTGTESKIGTESKTEDKQ